MGLLFSYLAFICLCRWLIISFIIILVAIGIFNVNIKFYVFFYLKFFTFVCLAIGKMWTL